jgi:hypothetical protein
MNEVNYKVRDGYPVDYASAWAAHRKVRRVLWGLLAGWIPYGAFVGVIILGLFPGLNSGWIFVAVAPYLIALGVVANLVGNFRCPRCGFRFFAWGPFGLGHNTFARKCRNCGLKKWQCDDAPHDRITN